MYKETPKDLTQQIAEMMNDRIRKLLGDGYIDDKTLDYLLVNSTPEGPEGFICYQKYTKRAARGDLLSRVVALVRRGFLNL